MWGSLVIAEVWQLFWDARDDCADCPRNLLLVERDPAVFDVVDTVATVFVVVVFVTLTTLIVRRVGAVTYGPRVGPSPPFSS